MRVLMLLSKSYRHDARVQKEAHALLGDGHDVTVLEWARHEPGAPPEEAIDGVRVRRIRPARSLAAFGPVAQNPWWWRAAAKTGRALHQAEPVDIIHAHDLDTLPAGVRLRRATGATLVFDAHEVFETMVRHDRGRLVADAAHRLERRLLPHVDRIVTVNEALETHYRARARAPVHVVMNCADPPATTTPPPDGPFTVVYVGLLSRARLFPDLVHAFGDAPDMRLVIAGKQEGNWRSVAEAATRYTNVRFLGAIPAHTVLDTMSSGHAVVCPLDPADPQYRVATATKVLDAMAIGRPSIATAGTYTGRLVDAHETGLVVPYDAAEIVAAARRLQQEPELAQRLGQNGRRAAEATFNWQHQAERLRALYDEIAAQRERTT